jgi:negative regulator of sigma-B (phosphoserine phosphatase)
MTLRVAHISVPKTGEKENGDGVLIRFRDSLGALLAVIDGLGHGPLAAQASSLAIRRLESLPFDLPLLEMMIAVHDELGGTIGAAGTICRITECRLDACAVGNVRLACSGSDVPFLACPGVLGHRIPRLRACACDIRAGTTLALFSDGIEPSLRLAEVQPTSPETACKAIMAQFRRRDDDATILVASMDGEFR